MPSESAPFVLLCGQVRKPEYVYYALRNVRDGMKNGILGGAIISTWEGEFDRYPGLRRLASDCGVTVAEIAYREGAYAPHSTYYQASHMSLGLDLVPDNAPVFKTRLDMAFNALPIFLPHLDRLRLSDRTIKSRHSDFPLENRVWLAKVSWEVPFCFHDRFIYASRRDMRKFVSFSSEFEFLYHHENSVNEVRWFAGPFIERFPIVRNILRIHWMKIAIMLVRGDAPKKYIDDYIAQFDFYWLSHALNYVVLRDGFDLGVPGIADQSTDWLSTPLRDHELPYGHFTADIWYASLLSQPAFREALEKIDSEAFHRDYCYLNDPSFEAMAAGLMRFAEYPSPTITVTRPQATPSDPFDGLEPLSIKEVTFPATEHEVALGLERGDFAFSLDIDQTRRIDDTELTLVVLVTNTGRPLNGNPQGYLVSVVGQWLSETGEAVEPAARIDARTMIVRHFRNWFVIQAPPDLSHRLSISLILENHLCACSKIVEFHRDEADRICLTREPVQADLPPQGT